MYQGSLGKYLGQVGTPEYLVNGQPVSSIPCGTPFTFDVPGYGPTIWLTETKNGVKTFDGLFTIPMAPYTSMCNQDEGAYEAAAFTVNNNQPAQLIGTTSVTITPATQPLVAGSNSASGVGMSSSTLMLAAAGIAAFLLLRKK